MITAYDLSDGREPLSYAEIDCLIDLARSLPPQPVIVNIGAATGVSTVAFLSARPDATIYSVDIDPCPQEYDNLARAGLDPHRVHRLLGRSQEIGPTFPGQCDLLFVDGDHWDAAGDIDAWIKTGKVKPGGWIAFHDYLPEPPPNNPGCVYQHVNAGMVGYQRLWLVERIIVFRNRS